MSKHCPPLALIMQMSDCVLAEREGMICLQEDLAQPGSHMLLINALMDRQESRVKLFHTNHYSLLNER